MQRAYQRHLATHYTSRCTSAENLSRLLSYDSNGIISSICVECSDSIGLTIGRYARSQPLYPETTASYNSLYDVTSSVSKTSRCEHCSYVRNSHSSNCGKIKNLHASHSVNKQNVTKRKNSLLSGEEKANKTRLVSPIGDFDSFNAQRWSCTEP
jgi:hypothetical protein